MLALKGQMFAFDNDGNVRRKGFASGAFDSLTWTPDNVLTQVKRYNASSALTETVSFTYDGLGRRATKTSSSTGTHSYLYRGDNLLAGVDTAGGVVTQYTHYDGIDAPQSVLYHGTTYYMTRELPGNVTALTTANSAGTGTIRPRGRYHSVCLC